MRSVLRAGTRCCGLSSPSSAVCVGAARAAFVRCDRSLSSSSALRAPTLSWSAFCRLRPRLFAGCYSCSWRGCAGGGRRRRVRPGSSDSKRAFWGHVTSRTRCVGDLVCDGLFCPCAGFDHHSRHGVLFGIGIVVSAGGLGVPNCRLPCLALTRLGVDCCASFPAVSGRSEPPVRQWASSRRDPSARGRSRCETARLSFCLRRVWRSVCAVRCVARHRPDASTRMRPAAVSLAGPRRRGLPRVDDRSFGPVQGLRMLAAVLRRAPLCDLVQRPFPPRAWTSLSSRDARSWLRPFTRSVRCPRTTFRRRESDVVASVAASFRDALRPLGTAFLCAPPTTVAFVRREPQRACSERTAVGACRRLPCTRSRWLSRPSGEACDRPFRRRRGVP